MIFKYYAWASYGLHSLQSAVCSLRFNMTGPDWLLVRPKLDPGLTNDLLMDKNYLQACPLMDNSMQ